MPTSQSSTMPLSSKHKTPTHKRSYALDALRGCAILAMVLTVFSPWNVLPAWMYHAQFPPPTHDWNKQLAGLTWVDLVFPFFLFSMGAAIPLALSGKLARKTPVWKLAGSLLTRWVLLIGFSWYIAYTGPDGLAGKSENLRNALSILSFIFVFAALTRLPDSWSLWVRGTIKTLGFAGAILFVALVPQADGSSFDIGRNEIIILILAHIALFGSVIWLLTQQNLLMRLGVMGLLLAFQLSAVQEGWVQWLYATAVIPKIFDLTMIKFLFIAIPGTLIGDLLLAWMRFSEKSFEKRTSWNRWRFVGIIGLMLFSIIAMLVGLQGRYLIATFFTGIGICIIGTLLLRKPVTSVEKLLHQFFSWGSFWLVLGLALEPYEGGIKKEDATLSFFFITTALAIFLLIALTVIIDVFRKKRWVQLLIDNGQNPMIAYIGRWTFVKPVLVLIGAEAFLTRTLTNPWPGFFHSVIITICVALFVSFCTKRKLFWRT